MSLADMMTEDCEKDLLIVGAMSNLLDRVNVAVLSSLRTGTALSAIAVDYGRP